MNFETLRLPYRVSGGAASAFRNVFSPRRPSQSGNPDFIIPARESLASMSGRSKRLFDISVALVLLILAAPLFCCLALIILAQRDGGPVVFKQKRIGYAGRAFSCLKFRSMCSNADQRLREILQNDADARTEWGATHKLMKDPRVTKIGAFLRATSIDELPQLWNVIRGDMSLVGPRPITAVELDGPYTIFNGRDEYLSVRPGLTGLWQVSGRSLVSYSNRVVLDKRYVETQSLLNDFKILLRTFTIVLLRRGAV